MSKEIIDKLNELLDCIDRLNDQNREWFRENDCSRRRTVTAEYFRGAWNAYGNCVMKISKLIKEVSQ